MRAQRLEFLREDLHALFEQRSALLRCGAAPRFLGERRSLLFVRERERRHLGHHGERLTVRFGKAIRLMRHQKY